MYTHTHTARRSSLANYVSLVLVLFVLFLGACKKEAFDVAEEQQQGMQELNFEPIETRSVGDSVPTILGAVKPNPFKVATMTQAWNELYGDYMSFSTLPVTHRYIRFEPADVEELKLLINSDLPFFDFPLDREVVQMGDHYPQPNLADDEIPDFYTILEASTSLPAIPHTVLEELVVPPMKTLLTAKAFSIIGEDTRYLQEIMESSELLSDPETTENCAETCPNYPACELFPERIGCSGGPFTPNCNPNSPDWPDCMEDDDHEDGPVNDCGCAIPANRRIPAGCIQVEDVELGTLEPVEDVKVTWWDGYFTVKTDRTDANGCWRIRGHSERGKAYMWVTFRNDKAKLRGFVGDSYNISRLLLPIQDYRGQLGGGTYNNVQVTYPLWNNRGGSAHRYWSASTVINAIHHFHREAQADGVNTPPMGLDVYLTANRRDGIALMTSQIPQQAVDDLLGQGLFSSGLLPYVISNMSVLSLVPDVAIGCNFQNSDRQYAITQHEIAHTSHFTNAGAVFWGRLGLAVLNAQIFTGSPWGDATVNDAGLIAICESWAEHLEHVYTDRRYGGNTSLNPAGRTWERELELTRNDSPNHVPIGLHFDLFDNMPDINNACDVEDGGCGPIVDNVFGFTNGQLFSLLDENTTDVGIYQNRILNGLLPGSGNTVADVNALFDSY